jgi:hypothetical protein
MPQRELPVGEDRHRQRRQHLDHALAGDTLAASM